MKKEITPAQAALVVIGVLLLIGIFWFWQAHNSAALEDATSVQVDAAGHRHLPGVAGRPTPPGANH
ncbi:MAG TPA: hypothetical protein VFA07_19950 [Chthonomonadaceae bacterium]|nr:hypothetical protein [Chthonomonadaceae bacterium]